MLMHVVVDDGRGFVSSRMCWTTANLNHELGNTRVFYKRPSKNQIL